MSFVTGEIAITQAYRKEFQEGFEQAYQQSESILDTLVDRDIQKSEDKSWQRIGEAEDMQEDTVRFGDNPTSNIPHDVRHISLRHFELGKYIVDPKDLMQVISDPSNAYTEALLKSGKRKRDDFLIEKYFADARTNKEGNVAVSYTRTPGDENDITIRVGTLSRGSSNKISTLGVYTLTGANTEGVSVGANYNGGTGAASGLTVEKLLGLRATMMRIEAIKQEDVIPLLITSEQYKDLLRQEEIKNADYNIRRSLSEGQITTYMGYRFIPCERLPLSTGAGGDERRCMAFLPKALKLTIGQDLKADMWRDSSKKNLPYIHFKQSIGASRMWGEVAGEIRCLES